MSKVINLLGYKNIGAGNLIQRLNTRVHKWKNRALAVQQEKRKLETRVRDSTRSKEHFKAQNKVLKQELKSANRKVVLLMAELQLLKAELGISDENKLVIKEEKSLDESEERVGLKPFALASPSSKTKTNTNTNSICRITSSTTRPCGSLYPYWQVGVSIEWYLSSSSGFRAIGTHWQVLSKYMNFEKVPTYGVIRHWVLRLGLYKLKDKTSIKKADDWVYIIDYSIQMGTEYCLLILGFRLSDWRNSPTSCLDMGSVQVLDLLVTEHPNGEQVKERLQATMRRTGVPVQLVADGGSKIGKGKRLWQEELLHFDLGEVIMTYDISHFIACLLKKFLKNHEDWTALVETLNGVQKRNQQSYAGFLAPCSLRKTARYMNLYEYADYLEALLLYEQEADFKLLARTWRVDMEASKYTTSRTEQKQKLRELRAKTATQLEQSLEELDLCADQLVFNNDGQKQFEERFGAILKHPSFIQFIILLVQWIRNVQKDLKKNGLSKSIVAKWEKKTPNLPNEFLEKFWQPLIHYLKEQAKCLPDDQIYLVTSDIIESVFAHYKSKVSDYWLKGMSALVLVMPAMIGQIDEQTIRRALENIKMEDVNAWFEQQRDTASFLSKRRQALKKPKKETLDKKSMEVIVIEEHEVQTIKVAEQSEVIAKAA